MFSKIINLRNQGEYPSGLSQEIIDEISNYSKEHFDCYLPKDYAIFLKETNGFSYDGYNVFCCYNDEIEKSFPRYSNIEFITFNTRFQDNTDISSYLILGKSSLDYLGFDKRTKKYVIMTNGTMKLIKESDNFLNILEYFFKV